MSETLIIAIIGGVSSILGAAIGAFATIRAADIRSEAENNGAVRSPSRGVIGLVASIAAVIGLFTGSVFAAILLQQLGYSQPPEQISDNSSQIVVEERVISKESIPQILATSTPILIGTISVPGNSSEGIKFTASQTGRYVFKYIDGAYSTYSLARMPEGQNTWLTAVRVFKDRPAQWNGDAISNSPDLNIADYGYSFSAEEAQSKAQDAKLVVSLLQGDYLTFVAVDGRPYYSDNPGEVDFEVFFAPK